MIRLKHLHTYYGPNTLADHPVIVIGFTADPTKFAQLHENVMTLRELLLFDIDGGSASPDAGGAGIADFVGALAVAMLNRLRGLVPRQKIVLTEEGTLCAIGYHAPQVTTEAMKLAVDLTVNVQRYSKGEIFGKLETFLHLCRRHHPDYQAHLLMDYAIRRDIPFLPFIPDTKYWQFGWGARSRVFFESLSNQDGAVGFIISLDKTANKGVFRALGAPTAPHFLASDVGDLAEASARIGFPCVVKPVDSGGGRGVSADVNNDAELREAFTTARKVSAKPIMVERWIAGDDHRLMVANGRFVGAVRRDPPAVTGDGRRTIASLIEEMNRGRRVNPATTEVSNPIKIDDLLLGHIAKHGHGLDTVPPAGAIVVLRSNSNVSTGGTASEVSDRVHPDLRALVEHMAMALGIGIGGFDYMTTDISASPWTGDGAFIELNSTPGLDICTAAGIPIAQLADPLFGDNTGRIPVRLFISEGPGPPPADLPPGTAVADDSGYRIGDRRFAISDAPGWPAIQSALRNRAVAELNIYATRRDIIARGLPLDRFDSIVLGCKPFPAPWQAVLKRCCEQIEVAGATATPSA